MNILTTIDVSSLLYSACYICNKEDNPNKDNFLHYKKTFDEYMQSIIIETKATHLLVFGDGYTSFRKLLFSDFKGDRKERKQIFKFMTDLKYYAFEKWNVINNNLLEADDLCLIHNHNNHHTYEPLSDYETRIKFDKIIIASKDSDLRQGEGLFFNYGYRQSKIPLSEAFETITKDDAEYNLWEQVLIKGHNNKLDYLEGCGKGTAARYLVNFSPKQLKLAVLNAFVFGVDKKKYNTPRNVKGYGLSLGIDKFSNAFKQTYLLRNFTQALRVDPEFKYSYPQKIIQEEEFINPNDLII